MSRLRRWCPVLFLAVVPILPLWRAVFLGEAIGPFDQIRHMAPWNGPAPTQAWDVLQADGVLQFYGWRDLVFESWRNGQLPLWNPYQLCGTPLLADSQSAAFYPPHVAMGVLHVPTVAAMTFLVWLHLFWAGLGVFVLARAIGATRIGAVVGGTCFSLSAFMLSWSTLPSVISSVAWIPWVLAAVYGVFGTGDGWRGTRDEGEFGSRVWGLGSGVRGLRPRRAAWNLAGLAVSVAMMLLAGHLQFAAYGLMAAGLVAVWLFVQALRGQGRGTRDKGSGFRDQGPGIRDQGSGTRGRDTGRGTRDAGRETRDEEAGSNAQGALQSGNSAAGQLGPGAAGGREPQTQNPRPPTLTGAPRTPDPGPRTPNPASLGLAVLGMALGAMLAAPQLLPVLNYGEFSHRAGNPTEEGYGAFVGGALKPFELTGLVYPGLLGNPTDHIPDLDVIPPLSAYWPQYAKRGSNFAETAVSVGPVVALMLCFLRRRRWRSALPMAAVGVLGLLVALGTPLARFLYFAVPGWSASGSTGRAGVLLLLAACTIAALGVRDDGEGSLSAKAYVPLLVFGVLTAASMWALQMCGSTLAPLASSMAEAWPSIVRLAAGSGEKLAVVAAAVCLAVGLALVRFPRQGRHALVAAAAAVPLLLCGGLVRTGSAGFLQARNAGAERYAFINGSWEIAFAVRALMPPNTASALRMYDVAGYDSLLHRDTVAMLRGIDGRDDPAPPANGNMMFVKSSADPGKLAEAGVTEVWSLVPMPPLGRPESEPNGILKHKLAGPGRASTPSGPATILEDGFDRQLLQADGPGKLVVRDRNMPGWNATVDGLPATIGGTLWREVELPPGRHAVSFRYRPPGLTLGLACMLASLATLAGATLIGKGKPPSGEVNTAQTL